jgi:hypothetical protein
MLVGVLLLPVCLGTANALWLELASAGRQVSSICTNSQREPKEKGHRRQGNKSMDLAPAKRWPGAHLSFCTPVSNSFPTVLQVSYYEEVKIQSATGGDRSFPANPIA